MPKQAKTKAMSKFNGWDFTRDGMFDYPRVKKKDKQQRKRCERSIRKEMTYKEIREYI